MEYRNEFKYICKDTQLLLLQGRLDGLMDLDKNLEEDGYYNIRSIYFDDIYDYCMNENEAGYDDRLKMRIRIYNHSSDLIKLELKYKKAGFTKKKACTISKELCEKLMEGEQLEYEDTMNHPVLNLVYMYCHNKVLRPKVIVEYDRRVYVNDTGNVRVTFDKNIRCSNEIERFFDENIYPIPVLEQGEHVLEVKYDELLPDYIAQALELGNLRQTAFSKYYLSRLQIGDY